MSSLSLSFELICLMNWLLKNEKHLLNNIIKQALANGLDNSLRTISQKEYQQDSEQLYNTILEFLILLEDLLAHNLQTIKLDSKTEEAIFPALRKMDANNLDLNALRVSMQETKSALSKKEFKNISQSEYSQQATLRLFQQFLKHWKPTKNEPLN